MLSARCITWELIVLVRVKGGLVPGRAEMDLERQNQGRRNLREGEGLCNELLSLATHPLTARSFHNLLQRCAEFCSSCRSGCA